jgi:enoyl-CoA hydratase
MTVTGPLVRAERAGGIATLTLDSPHNRNALSERLVDELLASFAVAAQDDAVRTIVLTHTGGTFCAGADLVDASVTDGGVDPARRRAEQTTQLMHSILRAPKPVIGRINGHVRAGGLGLVVAGRNSPYGLTESRLGLAASVISLTVLPRMTSRAASHMMLTGSTISAEEALTNGLVTEVAEEVDTAVDTLCAAFATCSPQGLRESKQLVNYEILAEFERSTDRVIEQSVQLFHSVEAGEGMAAFLEKRRPWWAE